VGILTFHRALNYGAVLQAYALQCCLKGMGAECDVIDYRCDFLERGYGALHLGTGSPRDIVSGMAHAPERIMKHRRFREFRDAHLRLSDAAYTREIVADADELYDLFVTGSDQVWNPDLTGDDLTFYLDFCDGRKRISYAASLGKSGSLEEYDKLYLERLSEYRAISVREEDSKNHLAALLQRDVEWVLDPVFLLRSAEWASLAAGPSMNRPYILVYCLHEKALYGYAEQLRTASGLHVVYVPESMKTWIKGSRVASPSVVELLGLIKHAEFVLTDSFHVLAFSIIFRRSFKVQLKGRLHGLNSRVTSLLTALGLEEQVIRQGDCQEMEFSTVAFEAAGPLLEEMVEESLSFLRAALGTRTTQ